MPAGSLGFPAVIKPRTTELREIQGTVDSIRQRLLVLDTAVTRLNSLAEGGVSRAQMDALRRDIVLLNARVRALELALSAAAVTTIIAGEDVALHDAIVMVGATTCGPANPNDPDHIHAVVGIATNAGTPGQPIAVQRRGNLTLFSESFTIGRGVYVDLVGLTQDPIASLYVIPVGIATSATTMWVAPGEAYIQEDTSNPGDEFLPITLALARTIAGGDVILYDDEGRAILTDTGEAILTA